MPDLTIETGWWCATNEAWEVEVLGTKGRNAQIPVYHVRWEKILDHRITEAEYGWTCTCPAFEFHPDKECKHIVLVKNEGSRCAWNEEMSTGYTPEYKDGVPICPECGGPLRPFERRYEEPKVTSRSFKSKMPWQYAQDLATELRKILLEVGMQRVEVCGSIRRGKREVGDLDLVVDGDLQVLVGDPRWSWVEGGQAKCTLDFRGAQVNLLRSDDDSWGAAILYFTGPHDYNIGYRAMAKRKGMLLNEKGLWKDGRRVAGRTEGEIYTALGREYKRPEERGKTGTL